MNDATSTLPRRRRPLAAAALMTFAFALSAGCETVQTTAPGAVGVERKQRMIVSEEQVQAGAAEAYATELKKAQEKGALNADAKIVQQVRRVTQRLIPVTATFRPDATSWKWETNVQTSDELNAYAMPGGKIMVYTGLIQKLDLSDAELAAVLGHEMAHALREHTRERVSRAYGQQIALAGIAAVTGAGQGAVNLANTVASVTFQLPHGREQESEADVMGLELMARAGYDPNAAVSVWQKMESKGGGGPPEFLSTHPTSGSRIKELQAAMPRVLPLYQAAKR